jgi:hypothetical protein
MTALLVMNQAKAILATTVLVIAACGVAKSPPQEGLITVNAGITYQTMIGWEATQQAGNIDFPAAFARYKDNLFDQTVDLGINRVRLEVESRQTNESFDYTYFDRFLTEVIVPLRQRLQARDEQLWVNVNVVGKGLRDDPALYAQNVLGTYRRMQDTVGFVPDSWEVALEPDTEEWPCVNVGAALVAAGDLLKANGYPSKVFVAPSSSNIRHAAGCFAELTRAFPGANQYLAELSYHIYGGVGRGEREAIWALAQPGGLRTSMLEKIGATPDSLHRDLKLANVSSWQQYTLIYGTEDHGGQYFFPNGNVVVLGSIGKFLRQYFKHVRKNAVRIDAQSTNPAFDPVAFRNANGKEVVVVNAKSGGSFTVSGLAPGMYGSFYTTGTCITDKSCTVSAYNVQLPNQSISGGQALAASIPDAGVITIYGTTSGDASPTPAPTAK